MAKLQKPESNEYVNHTVRGPGPEEKSRSLSQVFFATSLDNATLQLLKVRHLFFAAVTLELKAQDFSEGLLFSVRHSGNPRKTFQ